MSIALSEQEILRREKLNQLRALGINPYPPEEVKITATAQEILENFEKFPDTFKQVTIAGRIMGVWPTWTSNRRDEAWMSTSC